MTKHYITYILLSLHTLEKLICPKNIDPAQNKRQWKRDCYHHIKIQVFWAVLHNCVFPLVFSIGLAFQTLIVILPI